MFRTRQLKNFGDRKHTVYLAGNATPRSSRGKDATFNTEKENHAGETQAFPPSTPYTNCASAQGPSLLYKILSVCVRE